MTRTLSQNKQLHALLAKLQIGKEAKADLVHQFTGGRTDRSSKMHYNECNNLIKTLEQQYKAEKSKSQANRQYSTIEQNLRRKIFKLMYDIGFIQSSDNNKRKMFVINTWIEKKTSCEKTLNELTEPELNTVIKQLHTVRRIYEEKEKKQANWN